MRDPKIIRRSAMSERVERPATQASSDDTGTPSVSPWESARIRVRPSAPAREYPIPPERVEVQRKELRIYGRHAVLGVARTRRNAIRKVYYTRAAQSALGELLSWCAAERIGYREVTAEDLNKLAASEHHEGVVADIVRAPEMRLETLLNAQAKQAESTLLLLDGVANPHNLGAILRIAAHFNAAGILLMPGAPSALSGAAYRVAEGGAEATPLVQINAVASSLAQLSAAGFQLVAAHTREAPSLWQQNLPSKVVFVFGAEGAGLSAGLLKLCDARVSIPGSGAVESLNVAQSVAILMAEGERQRTLRGSISR